MSRNHLVTIRGTWYNLNKIEANLGEQSMLDRIRLQRFKKFQEVEVCLRPFTVLMGENSSGKTTVLQALNLALNTLADHNLVDVDAKGKIKIRQKGVGGTKESLPGLSLSDFRELYYAKLSRIGKGAGGAYMELIDDRKNTYRLRITSLFGDFNIKCISTEIDLANNPSIHRQPPLFISGFVGLRSAEERAFPKVIQNRLRVGQVSTIIRNLVLDAKILRLDGFEQLKARLVKDFDFHLDEIGFNEASDLFVTAHYRDLCGKNSISLDFNSSGSGFMQILQILAPIYLYCPKQSSIVLLDEPDAHLHPNLQTSLANVLREMQKELGIQIIISTHSTSIIRAADPSEVVPISSSRQINAPLTNSKDVEQQISATIDTYELGKSVISGKLLFVEDSNTQILDAFDKVIGTRCFSGVNTIPILKGKGRDNKTPFQIHEVLKEFVSDDVEIHLILDGDGLTPEWRQRLSEYAKKHNVTLHNMERHEIENYVLNPSLIHRILRSKYPNANLPSEAECPRPKSLTAIAPVWAE